MRDSFTLTLGDKSRLDRLGIELETDSVSDAVELLVNKLKGEIPDISDVYTLEELIDLHKAIFREYRGEKPKKTKPKKAKPKKKTSNKNRKKVRIDLTEDISYAAPLLEHLMRFSGLKVNEIKTGMAVKFVHGGYRSNVMNYLELRTVSGKLYGNLYFNMVKNDDQVNDLGIYREHTWFRTFLMIPKISVYDVIEILTAENMEYLLGLNRTAQKRKKKNAERLIRKFK